ncbi:MAG TPA: DUF4350 domain-containing protein [Anaerolineales bacterium]
MIRNRVWIALALIALPLAGRTLWHYRGFYRPASPIQVPAYAEFSPPQPPLTEAAFESREAAAEPEGAHAGPQKLVLFDQSHSNRFSMSELRSLTTALSAQGARIEVLDSSSAFDELGLEGRLKYASSFVVVAPSVVFSHSEVTAVEDFVGRGGRLLVVLDPTRTGSGIDVFGFLFLAPSDDVSAANQLLRSFDLSFSDDYLYNLLDNEGNFRNVLLRGFGDHPLTAGLQTVALYAARSVQTQAGTLLLSGDSATLSSLTDAGGGLAAAALAPGAQTLALGDLTFMTPPYDAVADNARFIHNLAEYLLGGERRLNLQDLPFVFSGPVSVVQSDDFSLQAETLVALRAMSLALGPAGVSLSFPADAPSAGDLLVLGLFEPDPELGDLIEPFDLVLPANAEDGRLGTPEFGSVNPAGIGFVGLARADGHTTLILLASDQAGLVSLLETVGQGLLSDCLFSESTALCQIGEGAGFGSSEPLGFDLGFEETFND